MNTCTLALRSTSLRPLCLLALVALSGCAELQLDQAVTPSRSREDPVAEVPRPIPARSAKVRTTESEEDRTTIELTDFEEHEASQEELVWCWAACASMILSYDGTPTSQEAIVERIHGYRDDGELKVATATRYEVLRALAPDAPASDFEAIWTAIEAELTSAGEDLLADLEQDERPSGEVDVDWNEETAVQSAMDRAYPSVGIPIDQLKIGDPAVVGLRGENGSRGHLYVLVGAEWSSRDTTLAAKFFDQVNSWAPASYQPVANRFLPEGVEVHTVELVNPLRRDLESTPENEMRETFTYEELSKRVQFVVTRADANEILTRWSRLANVEVK